MYFVGVKNVTVPVGNLAISSKLRMKLCVIVSY